jgi:hypothetical protein
MISNFLQILQSAGSPLYFSGLFDPVSEETFVRVHVMMLSMVFSVLISVLHESWNFFHIRVLEENRTKTVQSMFVSGTSMVTNYSK